MALAPFRIRRNPPSPPPTAEHYLLPTLADTPASATLKASEVPWVGTPAGRWREWPPLVLSACDEPLADGAPDIRGVWRVYKGALKGHIERVEQSGARVVITASGIIHDLTADGSLMRDTGIGGADIAVAARFEDERVNLYVNNKRLVVTRYLDGDDMIWRWGPYTNRLRRMAGPKS